jgi:two-component system, NarL family, nitrate/nitrite response regulator NarL
MKEPADNAHEAAPIMTLVVDDSILWTRQMLRHLTDIGCFSVVGIAHDGIEALHYAAIVRPALMLLDVNMPRMNGLEAATEVRSRFPDIRIVMMSVDDSPATRAACLQSGAHAFIGKAQPPAALLAAILEFFPAHRQPGA